MSRSTPWGIAHSIKQHFRGVATVSTSTHGGLMVSDSFGFKHLSEEARKVAEKYNGYFCFEEDTEALLAMYDLKEYRCEIAKDFPLLACKTADELEEWLIDSLSGSHPIYLMSVGVEPRGESYEIYKKRQEFHEAYAAKSPNLIVTAFGEHEFMVPGVIKVITADENCHAITKASYEALSEDKIEGVFKRLDRVEIVDIPTTPIIDRLVPFAVSLSERYLELLKTNPQANKAELEGNFYGARSRFNGHMNTVKESFIKLLRSELNLSYDEAASEYGAKLAEIKKAVSSEFHNCVMFKESVLLA